MYKTLHNGPIKLVTFNINVYKLILHISQKYFKNIGDKILITKSVTYETN